MEFPTIFTTIDELRQELSNEPSSYLHDEETFQQCYQLLFKGKKCPPKELNEIHNGMNDRYNLVKHFQALSLEDKRRDIRKEIKFGRKVELVLGSIRRSFIRFYSIKYVDDLVLRGDKRKYLKVKKQLTGLCEMYKRVGEDPIGTKEVKEREAIFEFINEVDNDIDDLENSESEEYSANLKAFLGF